jgi:hypothetical protein
LQALLIRLKKIYVLKPPGIKRHSVELFIDFECIPDRAFFYLFGVNAMENNSNNYYYFWSNSKEDEKNSFKKLLGIFDRYKDFPIYHYGSIEKKALQRLGKKYELRVDDYVKRLINVVDYIYGKIYFPLKSNSLKEIGNYIGATWNPPDLSGIKSIAWRMYWDLEKKQQFKNNLIQYNEDDCLALYKLVCFLSSVSSEKQSIDDIDCFVYSKKPRNSQKDNSIHKNLENLLKYGHTYYENNKIQLVNKKKKKLPDRYIPDGRKRRLRKVNSIVEIEEPTFCPSCMSSNIKTLSERERIQIELRFFDYGVKKDVVSYQYHAARCIDCNKLIVPDKFNSMGSPKLYCYGFKTWIAYQRVALRQPYGNIRSMIKELFDEDLCDRAIMSYMVEVGSMHQNEYERIIKKLLDSAILCIDDTQINVDFINRYVWVFTNGEHVYYLQTENRESTFLTELLSNFKGILISDFFAGFDKIDCKHQKCLAHIIRDINSDLWANQFDKEFMKFVKLFSRLVTPIIESSNMYGLKRKYLIKYRNRIDRYYQEKVQNKEYNSTLCLKYQKRFKKYWESLFTFIAYDGVPWHNNLAENALRQVTLQQDVSKRFSKSTIKSYLVLLSLKQTCRFQGKSFLRYILNKESSE